VPGPVRYSETPPVLRLAGGAVGIAAGVHWLGAIPVVGVALILIAAFLVVWAARDLLR
jgi:Flp pilus assembly protein TadB